jgi:hypothetical protein
MQRIDSCLVCNERPKSCNFRRGSHRGVEEMTRLARWTHVGFALGLIAGHRWLSGRRCTSAPTAREAPRSSRPVRGVRQGRRGARQGARAPRGGAAQKKDEEARKKASRSEGEGPGQGLRGASAATRRGGQEGRGGRESASCRERPGGCATGGVHARSRSRRACRGCTRCQRRRPAAPYRGAVSRTVARRTADQDLGRIRAEGHHELPSFRYRQSVRPGGEFLVNCKGGSGKNHYFVWPETRRSGAGHALEPATSNGCRVRVLRNP